MNDHNLDDLIIDTPSKKGGKAKGLLTIIALFIVVLIVAIILTKIILKDPNADHAALVEDNTEMISPELTLQDTPEESKEDETALSEMIESEMKAPEEKRKAQEETKPETVAEETVVIEEEKVAEKPKPTPVAPAKPAEEKKPAAPKTEKPTEKEIVKIPAAAAAPKPAAKPKPVTKPEPVTKPKPVSKSKPKPAAGRGNFYIQVGSFSKMPSSDSRLISALRKQGYRYRIMKMNNMHKVMVGPYKSRPEVDRAIVRVKDLINKSAFVVKK
jgi:cell division protein FtsN